MVDYICQRPRTGGIIRAAALDWAPEIDSLVSGIQTGPGIHCRTTHSHSVFLQEMVYLQLHCSIVQ